MLIIADQNIPFAREAFGVCGEVRLIAGRAITPNLVREAEALLVRSVTRVNRELLEGSRVKFVGTATIGTDHIDLDYLQQRDIAFASAAGCNANSVAEYVVAALLHVAAQRGIALEGLTLGLVGAGNVGSRVAEKARALGLIVLVNDPPLEALLDSSSHNSLGSDLQQNLARLAATKFHRLDNLMHADFITLHTPLVRRGPHATFHLFDEKRMRQMKPGSVLINTARGEVVDNLALKNILRSGLLSAAILDVWEHEPQVDPELVELTTLATPHIAGYSFDGKLNGTLLIYEALCRFLQIEPSWDYAPLLPPVVDPEIVLREDFLNYEEHPFGRPQEGNDALKTQMLLREAARHAYDIVADDARLRASTLRANDSKEERGRNFDKLRHEYPIRREFYNYRIQLPQGFSRAAQQLRTLGFGL